MQIPGGWWCVIGYFIGSAFTWLVLHNQYRRKCRSYYAAGFRSAQRRARMAKLAPQIPEASNEPSDPGKDSSR